MGLRARSSAKSRSNSRSIASQLVITVLGMIPLKHWRGIQARRKQLSLDRAAPLLARSAAAKGG
jgi:hypothetical protein